MPEGMSPLEEDIIYVGKQLQLHVVLVVYSVFTMSFNLIGHYVSQGVCLVIVFTVLLNL